MNASCHNPMTEPAASTAYVDQTAQRYDQKRFTTKGGKAMHRAEFACLDHALQVVGKDARVLEVGCGTGRLLLEAREMGYQVDGIDASPDMLALLRSKAGPAADDIDLRLAEAAKLPHEADAFDLVYAIRVLSPTGSKDYALATVAEMIRVAKPGGYVLVEFQNHYRPRLGVGKRPSVRLKPKDIVSQGREHGAQVVAYLGAFFAGMQTYHYAPSFVVGVVSGIDRALSWLFPRLCARSYVLFRKAGR